MNRLKLLLFIILVAVVSFLAGSRFRHRDSSPRPSATGHRILYYYDPMHPSYKSDKPGIAPDCGMELAPMYEDKEVAASSEAMPVGAVRVSPEQQLLMGVRVAEVTKSGGERSMRLLGRVAADENRIYRLNSAVEGWVRRTENYTTGSLVKRDERLASFYSPEFYSAQQAYFYALGAVDRFRGSGMDSPDQIKAINTSVQTSADSLRNLGMSDLQIAEISKTRLIVQDIWVTSPVAGLILARNISAGQRFEKGTEFYRIADLSHIWILADVFENEAEHLRPATRVRVEVPNQQKTFVATVSDVPPSFDPATRTLKLRLEADNPGSALRPDMFVDVELPFKLPAGVSVPADAVLDSGLRKTVFVDRGNGLFEPRQVETGWRTGDRVEIVKGLMAGERVVVDGNFFIDSESRLKAAASGVHGDTAKDPTCGMTIDQSKAAAAGRKFDYRGTTYFFCSDQCRRNFERDPARYVDKAAGTAGSALPSTKAVEAMPESGPGAVTDPACNMIVDPKKAATAGLKSEYRGVTYYFCSQGCKRNFDKTPERYVKRSANTAAGGGAQ